MGYSILLLENDSQECVRVSEFLRDHLKEPTEVYCCRRYEEAFSPLFCRQWDLILINFELKPKGGLDALRRIKTLLEVHELPPIVIYGLGNYDYNLVTLSLKEGANDFISLGTSTHEPQDLIRVVKQLQGYGLSNYHN